MSQKKRRKEEFLKAHPICCFCGGIEPATTEDHIPSRTIFENRAWPEGFVFPACKKCNSESSDDEIVVALLARITERPQSENQKKEFESKLHEFTRQLPNLRQGIKYLRRPAEKKLIQSYGMTPWNYQTGVERKALVFPNEAFKHVDNFGRKLGKALHYYHTKSILPVTGTVTCKSHTNADINLIPNETFEKILRIPLHNDIVRSSKPLHNQFTYRYAIVPESNQGVYAVAFGIDSLTLLITVDPTT